MVTAVKRRAVERMKNKMSSFIFATVCTVVECWIGLVEERRLGLGFMKKDRNGAKLVIMLLRL
jgi:hypothetical protein